MRNYARGCRWLTILLSSLALVPAALAVEPALRCEIGVATQLRTCVRQVTSATRRCYQATGMTCPEDHSMIVRALDRLERRVARSCPDDVTVQSAGYGALATPEALVDRLLEACRGEAAALAARSFGGPHARALAIANDDGRRCLSRAHRYAVSFVKRVGLLRSACIQRERQGRGCDLDRTEARIAAELSKTETRIARACPNLSSLVALGVTTFVEHTDAQARCLTAVAHPDPSPLSQDCGPRAGVPVPARGTAVQVVLPESEWGSRCGDGSSYAFWVQLPDSGEPSENVLIFMQGGGVCIFEDDCAGVSSGLLRATDNSMITGGFMSSTASTNPFRDWTKVYLPYCTQDIHIGGGTTSNFPSRTIHRFGAINVRAALRYLRDVLWADLNATSVEGYRPDRLRVILSGGSAGGFGASYNYHYVLDDLRWAHTTAAPDSSLGLNSGGLISIGGLGALVMNSTSAPLGWGSREYLPPYCFGASCSVIPTIHAAHSLRLKAVPEQQILNVSNQVDTTQVATTFFPSLVSWIDALRTDYCATQGMNGIRFFLPASTSHIHGILAGSLFNTLAADGVVSRDWLSDAMTSPDTVEDRVEEGAVAATYGAIAFPCSVD